MLDLVDIDEDRRHRQQNSPSVIEHDESPVFADRRENSRPFDENNLQYGGLLPDRALNQRVQCELRGKASDVTSEPGIFSHREIEELADFHESPNRAVVATHILSLNYYGPQ